MSMLRALALLGTGAESYVQGTYDQAAQKRLQSAEDFAQSQRAFKTSQDQRVLDQQAADAQAAAPVTPQPDMVPTPAGEAPQQRMLPDPSGDNIDAGQPGTAAPIPAQTVGGQGGLTPMQATQAAAAANTPEAVQARQIAARQATDPIGAAAMQAHVDAARSSKIDIANKMFDNDLNTAAGAVVGGDWTPLEKVLSDSGATGKHGAKFIPTPDGKQVEANIVMPDGTLKPTGKFYDNGPEGAQQAAAFLSKATPIQAKVAHALAARSQSEKQAHDEAMESNAAERNKVLENYYTGKNLNGEKAVEAKAKSAIERMSPDDKAEYEDLKKKSEALDAALTKGRMDAAGMGQSFDIKNPTIAPLIAQKFALDQKLNAIYGKYRDTSDSTAAPDPLGLRAKPASTSASGAAAQAAVGKSESDRLPILQAELAKATTDTDRAAIQREIDGLPKSARKVGAMQTAAVPTAAPTPAPAAAPKPGPMAVAAAPTGDKVLNAIEAKHFEDFKPLNAAVDQAKAQLAAVAKSGDPVALNRYASALTAARAARDKAVKGVLGDRASAYIASVDS